MSTEKQREKTAVQLADEELLAAMGYKQEFQRAFTGLEVRSIALCSLLSMLNNRCQTFGIAFSIIGLLPSIA